MSMKMKQLPILERPYEKLEMYGAHTLSNTELLAIIIKSGTKEENSIAIAQRVLSMNHTNENTLKFLQDLSIEEFMKIKGIGKVKAIQLKAVCELAKRISRPISSHLIKINSCQDIANLLMNELRYEKREIVKVVILNTKNVLIKVIDICFGSTNRAVLTPQAVLTEAIKIEAPKIIVVHNHPSGDATPSQADIEFTLRLRQAAEIVGIELVDHIVLGDGHYTSIFYELKNKKGD